MTPRYTMVIFDENKVDRKVFMELPWEAVADLTMYELTDMTDDEIKTDVLEQVMPFVKDN